MAVSIHCSDNKVLKTRSYLEQKEQIWPKEGKHILAQYDDTYIVVYQAFCPEIAEYAVKNQKLVSYLYLILKGYSLSLSPLPSLVCRFGGPAFSYSRMSWIKTNFLWMMYRCGWASKKNQERVLAVWITREGFHEILSHAATCMTILLYKQRAYMYLNPYKSVLLYF